MTTTHFTDLSETASRTSNSNSNFRRMVALTVTSILASAALVCAMPVSVVASEPSPQNSGRPHLHPRQVDCSDSQYKGYVSLQHLQADMLVLDERMRLSPSGFLPPEEFSLCPGTVIDMADEPLRPLFSLTCPTKDCVIRGGHAQLQLESRSLPRDVTISGITFSGSTDASVSIIHSGEERSERHDSSITTITFEYCHWKENTGRASLLITPEQTSGVSHNPSFELAVVVRSSSITHGFTTAKSGDVYRPIFSAHANLTLSDVEIAHNIGGFLPKKDGSKPASSFAINLVGGTAAFDNLLVRDNDRFSAILRPTRGAQVNVTDSEFSDSRRGVAVAVVLGGSRLALDGCRLARNRPDTAELVALQGSEVVLSRETRLDASDGLLAPIVSDASSKVVSEEGVVVAGRSLRCAGVYSVPNGDVETCLYGGGSCPGTCLALGAATSA